MNRTRARNKLTPAGIALVGLFAIHACMIAAVNLGLELTHAEQDAWMAGVLVPGVVDGRDRGIHPDLLTRPKWPRIKVVKEDQTMRTMREFGFTGPITREDYLNFIHATDEDPQPLDAEMESLLPEHLQAWEIFHATKHRSAIQRTDAGPPPRWAPPGTPLADEGNVLSFAARRDKLHKERVAALHPARRSTLELLKNTYPNESEESCSKKWRTGGFKAAGL
jgi:hypothetical protein